jgi:4'-phosphopantetheinyl transferase
VAARHEAAVWLLDTGPLTEEALAPFAAWLDASEARRMAAFVRPGRRRQFLAGRALARQALGQLLGMAPQAVRFVERPGDAPLLALPGLEQVGFNISHSGRWVACAVSATMRVGLDIEVIDSSRNLEELAAQAFSVQQQAWLAARPDDTRAHDFYLLWSAAEAHFKLKVPCEEQIELPHPALSVVLCCEHKLSRPARLQDATLGFGPSSA